MIIQVISGGQTGADRAGLETARELGIKTGGYAPKFYMTENGPDPSLADFGLIQMSSEKYPPRTFANARTSDGTVWFGFGDSRGYRCTMKAVDHYKKPWYPNPTAQELKEWLLEFNIRILNVAGNRASLNPQISEVVRRVLTEALK